MNSNANFMDHRDKTVLRCFKRFLQAMLQFRDLEIVLSNVYKTSDVPNCARGRRPVIMDPVCPFHNLGLLRADVIRTFEDKARATLKKLSEFERSSNFEFGTVFDLECGVQPQDMVQFLCSD